MNRSTTSFPVPTAGLLAILAFGGCAMFPDAVPTITPAGGPESRRSTSAGADDTPGDQKAVLSAVEEFLQRTQNYDATAPEPGPASDQPANALAVRSQPPATASPPRDDVPVGGTIPAGNHAVANAQVAVNGASPTAQPDAIALPPVPVIQSVTVRPVLEPSAPQAPTARTKTVNEPLATNADPAYSVVERFLQFAEEKAAANPGFESLWRLRLAQLAVDQPLPEPPVDDGIAPDARDLLTQFIRVAEEIRRLARLPNEQRNKALAAVDALRTAVAEGSELAIPAVVLCKKVLTFGVFEPMDEEAFVSGRPVQTIVYTELAHFRSEPVESGSFQTRLRTELELLTSDGKSVWQHEESEIVDECRRRRSDFFIAQRIALPPTLPAGDYVMKVRVEDKLSGRLAEASHPIRLRSALNAGRTP